MLKNSILIWRDVLPQHFPTPTGAYSPSLIPLLHNVRFIILFLFLFLLCAQYCQYDIVKKVRDVVLPFENVFVLPAFEIGAPAYYAHNIQPHDCTHLPCIQFGIMCLDI